MWNVKLADEYILSEGRHVLIETLWNVKRYGKAVMKGSKCSINRNIVECKDGRQVVSYFPGPVLIETLWNVKYKAFLLVRKESAY